MTGRTLRNVATSLLVGAGLTALAVAGWLVWGTPTVTAAGQRQLQLQWAATPPTAQPKHPPTRAAPAPPDGAVVARLWLPRLRLDWVVVQGVTDRDLQRGPGHYPTSAMPGQVGNFAVAGHRIGGVFADLDQLQPGDAVLVQARTGPVRYRYLVTSTLVVDPTAVGQVAPVPGRAGVAPAAAVLTLTTCWPRWGNTRRLVIHAALVGKSLPAS